MGDLTIQRAMLAAHAIRAVDRAETLEGKRALHLEYGRSLLLVRRCHTDDNAFHNALEAHNLVVRTRQYRTSAMWLALRWEKLEPALKDCTYSDPGDIREWWRNKQGLEPEQVPRPARRGRGKSPQLDKAREAVRAFVEAGHAVPIGPVADRIGVSANTITMAVNAEQIRVDAERTFNAKVEAEVQRRIADLRCPHCFATFGQIPQADSCHESIAA